MKKGTLAIATFLTLLEVSFAQPQQTPVHVPAVVTDLYDHYVAGLTPENFQLFEDGIRQNDVQVSMAGAPFSLAVILDTNDGTFVRQALEAFTNSELCLIQMTPEAKLAVPFTTNIGEIRDKLIVPTTGRQYLLDAIHVATTQLKNARNARRAILIISDSRSLTFRFDQLEAMDAAAPLDVPVYVLNLWQPVRDGWYPFGPALAKLTAGVAFDVGGADQARSVAERIRMELQNTYILRYRSSKAPQDGTYRQIRVEVQLNGRAMRLPVRHRAGYYANNQ